MLLEASIYQTFSLSGQTATATGVLDTETLLFSLTEKEYNNLFTVNILDNLKYCNEVDMGFQSYVLYVINDSDNPNDQNEYQLNNFSLQTLEDTLQIDFTTEDISYELNHKYSSFYNSKKLYDQLANEITNNNILAKKPKI